VQDLNDDLKYNEDNFMSLLFTSAIVSWYKIIY